MVDDSLGVRKAILVIVAVISLVVIVGFVVYERPSIGGVENRFGNVNESWTAVETDIIVRNPNPLGITLGDATTNYTMQLNGITIARGTERGIPLPAGNTTIEETTLFDNSDIPDWWVSHIRNGERTHAEITVHVDTSLFGQEFTRTRHRTVETPITDRINTSETQPVDPIDASIPLPAEPPLYVNETSAKWEQVTENRTFLDLSTTLYNPSGVPYPISKLEYTLSMNNITIGHGATSRSYFAPSRTEQTINGTLVIDNSVLDEWWISHIESNQTTVVQVDITAVIELPNGDTLRLPLDSLSQKKTFETDLLGEQNRSVVR